MPRRMAPFSVCLPVVLGWCAAAAADDAAALRLVPFPKVVHLQAGTFDLGRPLVLTVPGQIWPGCAESIVEEFRRAKLPPPKVETVAGGLLCVRLAPAAADLPAIGSLPESKDEDAYALEVRPTSIICGGRQAAGVIRGVQTLRQLIRANRRDDKLPCLAILDWPSLRWRCFQNDMTRGPSATADTLGRQLDLGAELKMNLFTYYMEYQFAFHKHPAIGPKDGSLTVEELKALVERARLQHVGILGNQQSFGHMTAILQHPEYADLRETANVLSPANEKTYQLLDDLYSEVMPALPFPWFNVCCDETQGLGTGPSKQLAAKIGEGGVYAAHVCRIHDLLKAKYGKRMMMWGDIILCHPDKLHLIPRDTILLTWDYEPRPDYEQHILPFARSGYEFFVCPGVWGWNHILPDFAAATVNIRNFVRDGVKHGALGMLNTDWKDDAESLQNCVWHGYAWGAECAWNASTTTPEDFNRRLGAVLIGERGDHYGRAIGLLSQTDTMAGMDGMLSRRYWKNDFLEPQAAPRVVRREAEKLLAVVRPAIAHLEACRRDAVYNADFLDEFLFGARRMEQLGQRMLDGLEVLDAYQAALAAPPQDAVTQIARIEALARRSRDANQSLGREYQRLRQRQSKPFALDWVMRRYQRMAQQFDDLLVRLAAARKVAAEGGELPLPAQIGLVTPEQFARCTLPHHMRQTPLAATAAWADPSATHRLGIVVEAGKTARYELPIELDLALPEGLRSRPVRAFWLRDGAAREIVAQLDRKGRASRLTLVIPGPISAGRRAEVHVYLGLNRAASPLPQAVATRDADGAMKWIENDKLRLLLGPEGGHLFRWEVKALGNRDLTLPGDTGFAGFADLGGTRRAAPNRIQCIACGPALVRYRCTDAEGLAKDISLFGGASWVESVLSEGTKFYWEYDDPQDFAADGPTPGTYLFSTGKTGPVGRRADNAQAQVYCFPAHWSLKFNPQKLALGLVTPEADVQHGIGPGGGWGGVGIQSPCDAAHFITFGGLLEVDGRLTMTRLDETLDFRHQPVVSQYAVQKRD